VRYFHCFLLKIDGSAADWNARKKQSVDKAIIPILGLQYSICLSYWLGQVKSSLFLQGVVLFNTRLVSIWSLRKNTLHSTVEL